ncbi:MAG: type 1 glutamine amidotransferase domain-containing protein [Desulfuromonadaceae bacterium]|nr:type 1 glutamine amidotransferase domain-containing protein [Desulfobulbus sp.]
MKKIVTLIGLILLCAIVIPEFVYAKSKQVLIVVTSTSNTPEGKPTGLWLEEFAVPYLKLKEAGFEVTVASTKGGETPLDPRSLTDGIKVQQWKQAVSALKKTATLTQIDSKQFDAIFLPGGHGTMFDLPNDQNLKSLLNQFAKADKVIAAVCHGPAGFVGAKRTDGSPLVAGKTITSFTDEEEAAAELGKEVPFLLESKLREEGAKFVTGAKWASHAEVDGKLVTGQNPASSEAVANEVIKVLK